MNRSSNTARLGSVQKLARRACVSLLGLVMLAATALVGASASPASAASAYYVGNTGLVSFYEPTCTNYGYDMLSTGRTCYYGHADVYQNSGNYVYKDVNVWADGVRVVTDRFVTQCTPGRNLCGTTNVWTVWMRPGQVGFVSDTFQLATRSGVHYTFQTTVWFYEAGRWLSKTLTNYVYY